MRVKVDVTDEGALHSLRGLAQSARAQGPTMRELGRHTAQGITGVPVRTGRLAASMGVLVSGPYGFVVGSKGVPYAHYVFDGTKNVRARPPKVPPVGPEAQAVISSNVIRSAR